MTPTAPPPPPRRLSGLEGPTRAIGFAPSQVGHFADDAGAALDTLCAAWRIDPSPPLRGLAARLVRPRSYAAHEPFLAWLERSCGKPTLAALSVTARESASSRFALIRARGRATFDVVQEVAQPLWADVFAAWAGLPDQQRRRLRHLAPVVYALAAAGAPSPRGFAGLIAALDELRRIFGQAYRHPRYAPSLPNLFSSLETGWSTRLGPIADETTAAAVQLLMTGGRAASELTGPAIALLASQPKLAARLRAAPGAAEGFVADFQTVLEQRRARFDAVRANENDDTEDTDAFAPLSRSLARMLTTAVVEAAITSLGQVSRDDREAQTASPREAHGPLEHLVLHAGS